jgi:hypothetical protein
VLVPPDQYILSIISFVSFQWQFLINLSIFLAKFKKGNKRKEQKLVIKSESFYYTKKVRLVGDFVLKKIYHRILM